MEEKIKEEKAQQCTTWAPLDVFRGLTLWEPFTTWGDEWDDDSDGQTPRYGFPPDLQSPMSSLADEKNANDNRISIFQWKKGRKRAAEEDKKEGRKLKHNHFSESSEFPQETTLQRLRNYLLLGISRKEWKNALKSGAYAGSMFERDPSPRIGAHETRTNSDLKRTLTEKESMSTIERDLIEVNEAMASTLSPGKKAAIRNIMEERESHIALETFSKHTARFVAFLNNSFLLMALLGVIWLSQRETAKITFPLSSECIPQSQFFDEEISYACINRTAKAVQLIAKDITYQFSYVAVSVSTTNLSLVDQSFPFQPSLYSCQEGKDCGEIANYDVVSVADVQNSSFPASAIDPTKFKIGNFYTFVPTEQSGIFYGRSSAYFMKVNFDESSFANIALNFDTMTLTHEKIYLPWMSKILRVLLVIISTVGLVVWSYLSFSHEKKSNALLYERRWLLWVSLGFILHMNPLYCVIQYMKFIPSVVVFLAECISILGLRICLLGLWFFADLPRREVAYYQFFLFKGFLMIVLFCTGVLHRSIYFPELFGSSRSPVQVFEEWGRKPRTLEGLISVLNYALFGLYGFCILRCVFRSFRVLRQIPYIIARYRHLSYKYLMKLSIEFIGLSVIANIIRVFFDFNSFNRVADPPIVSNVARHLDTRIFQGIAIDVCLAYFIGLMLYAFLPPSIAHLHRRASYVIYEFQRREAFPKEHASPTSLVRSDSIVARMVGRKRDPTLSEENLPFVMETALWLLELSWEAYLDPPGLKTNGSCGEINLVALEFEYCGHIFLEEYETFVLVARHKKFSRLVISFRGTTTAKHWQSNLSFFQTKIDFPAVIDRRQILDDLSNHYGLGIPTHEKESVLGETLKGGIELFRKGITKGIMGTPFLKRYLIPMVHNGFHTSYVGMRKRLLEIVHSELVRAPAHIYVTGHSMGGALASLCSVDLMCGYLNVFNHQLSVMRNNKDLKVSMDTAGLPTRVGLTLYNFGSPRVGNHAFAKLFDSRVFAAFRVTCDGDAVPGVPMYAYKHIGKNIVVNPRGYFIVEPTFIEKVLVRSMASKIEPHCIYSYRASLKACMRGFNFEALPLIINDPSLSYEDIELRMKTNASNSTAGRESTFTFGPKTYDEKASWGKKKTILRSKLRRKSNGNDFPAEDMSELEKGDLVNENDSMEEASATSISVMEVPSSLQPGAYVIPANTFKDEGVP